MRFPALLMSLLAVSIWSGQMALAQADAPPADALFVKSCVIAAAGKLPPIPSLQITSARGEPWPLEKWGLSKDDLAKELASVQQYETSFPELGHIEHSRAILTVELGGLTFTYEALCNGNSSVNVRSLVIIG
jgi:hypothetical protein